MCVRGVLCIETPNNACLSNVLKGRYIKEGLYLKDVYPPIRLCGFTVKTFRKMISDDIIILQTHNVYDTKWCYKTDRKKDLKHMILRRFKFSNNIACFVKKGI